MLDDLRVRLARWLGVEPPALTRVLRGIPVVVINTRPEIDTERVFQRVEATLDLVARAQPWRFRHLRRDLSAIAVRRFPCRAAFFPDTRTCLLELTFVNNPDFSEAQIAASLVHEGVHARIAASGAFVSAADKPREERLCRRAELELGLAVPDGAPVVERARAAMQLADEEVAPTIDWQEAARNVEAADAAARRTRE
jgi:hypothetical protein